MKRFLAVEVTFCVKKGDHLQEVFGTEVTFCVKKGDRLQEG